MFADSLVCIFLCTICVYFLGFNDILDVEITSRVYCPHSFYLFPASNVKSLIVKSIAYCQAYNLLHFPTAWGTSLALFCFWHTNCCFLASFSNYQFLLYSLHPSLFHFLLTPSNFKKQKTKQNILWLLLFLLFILVCFVLFGRGFETSLQETGLASSSPCGWRWPWTSDPSVLASWVLGLQACSSMMFSFALSSFGFLASSY